MMKRVKGLLAAVACVLVLASSQALSAPTKPVVLKAGSTWEESLLWNDGLRVFSEMVAKASNGELTVKFIGGPETFPTFESIEILRRGVVDSAQHRREFLHESTARGVHRLHQ